MATDKKTARFIRALEGFKGEAELYQLSPPLEGHEFVVISAVVAIFSGPETYIFPSSKEGSVMDWGELKGSFRGELNIAQALKNAGYTTDGGQNGHNG